MIVLRRAQPDDADFLAELLTGEDVDPFPAPRAPPRRAQCLVFELGYHRLELAVCGFDERALRHAERAGYVREGVKRKARWRHGVWQDAVRFALVDEDVEGGRT